MPSSNTDIGPPRVSRAACERLNLIARMTRKTIGIEAPPRHAQEMAEQTRAIFGVDACVIRLIEAATPGAPLLLHGGGHFEVALPPAEADRLLATLPSLDAAGAITGGAPDRRGRRSEPDRGAARLELGLAAALDPEGILR